MADTLPSVLVISAHADTNFQAHRLTRRKENEEEIITGHLDNFAGVHCAVEALTSGRLNKGNVSLQLTWDEEQDMTGAEEVSRTLRPTDCVVVLDVASTPLSPDKTILIEKVKNGIMRRFIEDALQGLPFEIHTDCKDPVADEDETDVYSEVVPYTCFLGVPVFGGDYNTEAVSCKQSSLDAVVEALVRLADHHTRFFVDYHLASQVSAVAIGAEFSKLVIVCRTYSPQRLHSINLNGDILEGSVVNFGAVKAVMDAYFSGSLSQNNVRIELIQSTEDDNMEGAAEASERLGPHDVVLMVEASAADPDAGTGPADCLVIECDHTQLQPMLQSALRDIPCTFRKPPSSSSKVIKGKKGPASQRRKDKSSDDDEEEEESEVEMFKVRTPLVAKLFIPCHQITVPSSSTTKRRGKQGTSAAGGADKGQGQAMGVRRSLVERASRALVCVANKHAEYIVDTFAQQYVKS